MYYKLWLFSISVLIGLQYPVSFYIIQDYLSTSAIYSTLVLWHWQNVKQHIKQIL